MNKYLILGGYEPEVITAEDWESALWETERCLGESLQAIVKMPPEDEENETD